MRIEDEPLEKFYPRCVLCGEPIEGEGYQIESEYFCENCISECKIDGADVANSLRDAAYENAQESLFS